MTIEATVQQLIRTYHTSDPGVLARSLGIKIYERNDFQKLLGMYARVAGSGCIFLNAKMSEEERRIVLAHELGHAVLHGEEEDGIRDIVQFTLFGMTNQEEYEANVFAAHLLLDEQEVQSLAEEGYDLVSLARLLRTDVNLLLLKLHEMRKKGFPFPALPERPSSDFLGKSGRSGGE